MRILELSNDIKILFAYDNENFLLETDSRVYALHS